MPGKICLFGAFRYLGLPALHMWGVDCGCVCLRATVSVAKYTGHFKIWKRMKYLQASLCYKLLGTSEDYGTYPLSLGHYNRTILTVFLGKTASVFRVMLRQFFFKFRPHLFS